jgi:hypothetical protein
LTTPIVIGDPDSWVGVERKHFPPHNPWLLKFSSHLIMKIAVARFLFSLALATFSFAGESIPSDPAGLAEAPSDSEHVAETSFLTPTSTTKQDLLKTFYKPNNESQEGVAAISIELASYEVIDRVEKSLRRLPTTGTANDEREPNHLILISEQTTTTSNDVPMNHGIRGTKGVSVIPIDPTNDHRVLFEIGTDDETLLPLYGFLEDRDLTDTSTFDFSGTYHEFSMPQTTPAGYDPLP